jgi:hypothetical protein
MVRYMGIIFVIGVFLSGISGCGSKGVLTAAEQGKLDPQLQKLITGEKIPENLYNISVDASGEKRYSVIIITGNVDALNRAGIITNSVQGEIVTARLTVDELRRAANIAEVKSIKNTSKSYPQ